MQVVAKQRKISTAVMKGSAFRVIQTCIGIGIGFWMLPFLIENLGSEDYALWILIGSIVSSYYLMDLGLSHTVTRYVSKYIHTEEYDRANDIVNTAIVIYSVLGVILFAITILGAVFWAPILIENPENLRTAQTIIIIAGLSISLEFPSKAFPGVIDAYMRFDTLALVRIVASIINAIAIYIFVSNGYGVVSIAVISFVLNLVTTSFFIHFCFRLLPSMKITFKDASKKDLKEIYHFSKWNVIIDATHLLKSKMDLWLVAAFVSAGALTTYYVATRLTEYAMQFAKQALGFTIPLFTKYYAKKQFDKLEESFNFFLKLNYLVLVLFISGFFLVGESFLLLWVNGDIDYAVAYQCLIILSAGRFLTFLTSPFASILITINKHKYSSYLSIVDTIAAILSALYLIPIYGIIGAAISFSLVVGFLRVIYLPYIVIKLLGFNLVKVSLHIVVYSFYAVLVSFAFDKYMFNASSWLELLYLGCIVFLLIISGSILIFSTKERNQISQWFRIKFKKKT
ncbi:MAG: O-antigen/teichoic acid export membrane protein [Colwellia sp.]|jgi:O-antigen/teichoic acid export membrane protein